MADEERTSWLLMAGFGVATVIVFAAGFLVWRALTSDAPPQVSLGALTPAPSVGDPAPAPAPDDAPENGGSFDGTWAIDTEVGSLDDGSSSFAGYRIEEELGGIGTHTAVGRTENVQGTMTIVGTSVTALDVTVDMASLRSDDERRDSQLASRGLETARFPTATFTLVEPMALPDMPAEGETIGATAVGDLTLHGVTQRVEVPVTAQWAGEHIEVAATLEVVLADHDIEPPTGFLVLSIADTGTVELHLVFRRA